MPEDKKHRKEVERRKKNEAEKRRKEVQDFRRREAAKYPEIEFRGNAHPEFISLVKQSLNQINFDSSEFEEWERRVLKKLRGEGFVSAYRLLKELDRADPKQSGETVLKERRFSHHIGQQIFDLAGKRLEPFLLKNDIQVVFINNSILVNFRHLLVERDPNPKRDLFYSPLEPQIERNGKKYICGFTPHAMEQICDRMTPGWRTYAGHGDAFYFLHDCIHFIPAMIKDRRDIPKPGFSFFDKLRTVSGLRFISLRDTLLGNLEEDDGSGLYVRIGYCPTFAKDRFIGGITVLRPGYWRTPEAGCYRNLVDGHEHQEQLQQVSTATNAGGGMLHANPEALRYFHMNGFPQVVKGSDPLFANVRSTGRIQ